MVIVDGCGAAGLTAFSGDQFCLVGQSIMRRAAALALLAFKRPLDSGIASRVVSPWVCKHPRLRSGQRALMWHLLQWPGALCRTLSRWPVRPACDRVPSRWQGVFVFVLGRGPLWQRPELVLAPIHGRGLLQQRLKRSLAICRVVSRRLVARTLAGHQASRGSMSSLCSPSVRLSRSAMSRLCARLLASPCGSSALTACLPLLRSFRGAMCSRARPRRLPRPPTPRALRLRLSQLHQ